MNRTRRIKLLKAFVDFLAEHDVDPCEFLDEWGRQLLIDAAKYAVDDQHRGELVAVGKQLQGASMDWPGEHETRPA